MKGLRWIYACLVGATTLAVTEHLWSILRVDGLSALELAYLALVVILVFWITASFWLAAIGAYARWRGISDETLMRPPGNDAGLQRSPSRTALLYPIRNEEPRRLFAGIEAMREAIERRGMSDKFDIFVLSDSTSFEQRSCEAEACGVLRRKPGGAVFYRFRRDNTGRKSGNIAEFCRNWGASYDYMVVLDADSLMTAGALAQLVRLMDTNPRAALIQTSPKLAGRESLFARIQQFASSVYGPIYASGLSLLSGPGGNYWGHNAIIRVAAFVDNCGLPKLPGRAPLGGEIMSHDFVEAALLRRAGWDLHLAAGIEGSFEEPPPTIVDYLARDRRWCQGNLQHMRLLFARGFRAESRGHLAMGVMSYLSSPLWLAMLAVSLIVVLRQPHVEQVTYMGSYPVIAWQVSHDFDMAILLFAALVLLLAPKLFALLLLLADRDGRRAHGGGWNAAFSVFLETLFSIFLAPIMMLSQSLFVASILLGASNGWGTQMRGDRRMAPGALVRIFSFHTTVAAMVGGAVFIWLHGSFWWIVPLLAGPLLSIPLAAFTSSSAIGRWAMAHRLFLTPSETGTGSIVARVRDALHRHHPEQHVVTSL
jgi:membrane glycosyltransferase